jgi:hypothetical protein
MRHFSSYGPLDTESNYYAPREELIEQAYNQLTGENPKWGGHYITVWAPRQCGKTWIMQEMIDKIRKTTSYTCGIFSIERGKKAKTEKDILRIFTGKLTEAFGQKFPAIKTFDRIPILFTQAHFQQPVILVIDEFDALGEELISDFAAIFRDMYISRTNEKNRPPQEKTYLLHGLALVGVRSVLGIENERGSPFNVQRNLHIPNLTKEEVNGLFQWYEKETGQQVQPGVLEQLFYETNGQPGLTCWFGELITEKYNHEKNNPITMDNFEEAYAAATHILPNNNILNIISKVKKPPYDEWVLELFKTGDKIEFKFDDESTNYLYMNGVIGEEKVGTKEYYVKFSCPFVQNRLFNYFSNRIFGHMGLLIHPLDAMEDAITEHTLDIPNIIKRYKAYLKKNREVFFKDVPRRKTDMRIYEAIFHFNLYRYLYDLLKKREVEVIPQFPTGNGKIDLILKYREQVYALELKSFRDMYAFQKSIPQAADYGQKLGLKEIFLLEFVELKEEEVKELEQEVEREGVRVIVIPIGILP